MEKFLVFRRFRIGSSISKVVQKSAAFDSVRQGGGHLNRYASLTIFQSGQIDPFKNHYDLRHLYKKTEACNDP